MNAYYAVMRPVRDLPVDLELPLRSGEPWWYWLGGRPALDFANTLRERWNRSVETLVTPADLAGWLHEAGLVEAPPPTVTPGLLDDARALREAIDACVRALLGGAPAAAHDVARIDAWLPRAVAPARLTLDAGGTPRLGDGAPEDPATAAVAAVALDAARMLGRPMERRRVRVCASETCSARFYDRSPAGRRRWCSMSTCGNEAKARRHRQRGRQAA